MEETDIFKIYDDDEAVCVGWLAKDVPSFQFDILSRDAPDSEIYQITDPDLEPDFGFQI